MAKCQICKQREAIHYLQYIDSDVPTFYRPGFHIRGFSIFKVCDKCADAISHEWSSSKRADDAGRKALEDNRD